VSLPPRLEILTKSPPQLGSYLYFPYNPPWESPVRSQLHSSVPSQCYATPFLPFIPVSIPTRVPFIVFQRYAILTAVLESPLQLPFI